MRIPTQKIFVHPVPCAHIAAYYQNMWERLPQIGSNLLRQGYRAWAIGEILVTVNNLYDLDLPKRYTSTVDEIIGYPDVICYPGMPPQERDCPSMETLKRALRAKDKLTDS